MQKFKTISSIFFQDQILVGFVYLLQLQFYYNYNRAYLCMMNQVLVFLIKCLYLFFVNKNF